MSQWARLVLAAIFLSSVFSAKIYGDRKEIRAADEDTLSFQNDAKRVYRDQSLQKYQVRKSSLKPAKLFKKITTTGNKYATSSSNITACFPASSKIALENGMQIRMDELKVGDVVKTTHNSTSTVFVFSHKDASTIAEYVSILCEDATTLTVSGSHYIYVDNDIKPARLAKVGDFLTMADGSKSVIQSVTSGVQRRGLFNPHTKSGSIVVDGFLVTCYTEAVAPLLAHALLHPVRLIYNVSGVDLTRVINYMALLYSYCKPS